MGRSNVVVVGRWMDGASGVWLKLCDLVCLFP